MAARRKERPVSKGLLQRVSIYIRDNSINGVCAQDLETIAYHLGMTVELVGKVIDQLKDQGLIIARENDNPLLPTAYIYVGDGAASKLVLEVGQISDSIINQLDQMSLDQVKEIILDYDSKVRELLYEMQQQTQEVEAYRSFKENIVKTLDAADGLVHIIAKKRP
ncbi:hypothetical protein V6C27_00905 [Peptococcaceae bacterium 1198_IL3148]